MLIDKELYGDIGLQISPEATSLISTYGSFFIQCPQFTYIYIGGFQDCPLMLHHFVDDRLVLLEVYRKKSVGTKDQLHSQSILRTTVVFLLPMLKISRDLWST